MRWNSRWADFKRLVWVFEQKLGGDTEMQLGKGEIILISNEPD